jgi:AcrR family transcriptional regulator
MTTETATADVSLEGARRAQPLSLDDRQAMIIDAVIPLLIEHGRSVTSRQIAEAAGIAEGTIFRAFGDKESLLNAAIERYLDPEPLRNSLRSIDPSLALEDKVRRIVVLMHERFGNVFRVMAAIGQRERPPHSSHQFEFASIIAQLLEPDLVALRVPPERVAHFVRLVAFASSIPQFNESVEFTDDELVKMIMYGVAGNPASDASPE